MYTSHDLSLALTWAAAYSTILVLIVLYWVERKFQNLYEDAEDEDEEIDESHQRFLDRLGGGSTRDEEQIELKADERGIITEFPDNKGTLFYLAFIPKEEFEENWEARHGK